MTTEYKKALDAYPHSNNYGEAHDFIAVYGKEIRRALMMADAVESGGFKHPCTDPLVVAEWSYSKGWNNCLEHLRKIGDGE